MELVKRAIQSGEEAFSSDKRKYVKSLWSKAKATSELEMYHIAIEYGNATLQVMEQNGMASATDYVRRVVSVAGYYYQIRDFAGEIATLEPKLVKIPSACNMNFPLLAFICDSFGGEIHLSQSVPN